jgi:acyl carrier protein
MDTNQIIEQLLPIFKDVLDNEDIQLTGLTTAEDIEEWDSLSHIELTVAIERHFKIRFAAKEIQNWKNVGDLMESILLKLG